MPRDLVAYWKFDDGGEVDLEGRPLPHLTARDSSGQGNDLPLVVMPQPRAVSIQQVSSSKSSPTAWFTRHLEQTYKYPAYCCDIYGMAYMLAEARNFLVQEHIMSLCCCMCVLSGREFTIA